MFISALIKLKQVPKFIRLVRSSSWGSSRNSTGSLALSIMMINDLKVEKKNSFLWKFAEDSTLSERFQGIVQMILIIFNNGQWK